MFLAKMQHTDTNENRAWTIRLGQAGNMYSLVGAMGETVPPQANPASPWVEEVWQGVSSHQNGVDHDLDPTTQLFFLYEAGTYSFDGQYTTPPFYSPSLGSYCEDVEGECGFASWVSRVVQFHVYMSSVRMLKKSISARFMCIISVISIPPCSFFIDVV